uniref:Hepcidin-like antimicrobial peptide n=1 Tax=Columba livia TaxID=8932 RepID=B3F7V0_COLLI|nr:hepcidin-like antimicrobial peptide [Columba livia]
MAGCGLPLLCLPEPSISGWGNHPIDGVICPTPLGGRGWKPGMCEVWEGRCTPCFWLMSAGKWGEWKRWLKWSLLCGMCCSCCAGGLCGMCCKT